MYKDVMYHKNIKINYNVTMTKSQYEYAIVLNLKYGKWYHKYNDLAIIEVSTNYEDDTKELRKKSFLDKWNNITNKGIKILAEEKIIITIDEYESNISLINFNNRKSDKNERKDFMRRVRIPEYEKPEIIPMPIKPTPPPTRLIKDGNHPKEN